MLSGPTQTAPQRPCPWGYPSENLRWRTKVGHLEFEFLTSTSKRVRQKLKCLPVFAGILEALDCGGERSWGLRTSPLWGSSRVELASKTPYPTLLTYHAFEAFSSSVPCALRGFDGQRFSTTISCKRKRSQPVRQPKPLDVPFLLLLFGPRPTLPLSSTLRLSCNNETFPSPVVCSPPMC